MAIYQVLLCVAFEKCCFAVSNVLQGEILLVEYPSKHTLTLRMYPAKLDTCSTVQAERRRLSAPPLGSSRWQSRPSRGWPWRMRVAVTLVVKTAVVAGNGGRARQEEAYHENDGTAEWQRGMGGSLVDEA